MIKSSEKEVKQTLDLVGARKDEKGNFMIMDGLIREIYQNGKIEGIEEDRIELEDKALELFNDGEIDEKQYDFLVNFLDKRIKSC